MGRKTFTPKFKYDAVQLVVTDELTVEQAAKQKKIGKSTLGKWVRKFKDSGQIDMEFTKPKADPAPKKARFVDDFDDCAPYKEQIRKLKQEKEVLKQTIAILMGD